MTAADFSAHFDERRETGREERSGRNGRRPPPGGGAALPLVFADDIDDVDKHWLTKGVLARGEISSWIGPPGAGKSALLLDLCVHLASGLDWRDYATKGAVGVIYFALERSGLTKRRVLAYRKRGDLKKGAPLAICGRVIDLMDPACVDIILNTIGAAEQRFGVEVGLIVIDTYNKGIAAGGGDENLARDQNIAAANMRRILERADIHIAGVGHTGKDETRGERGSNARLADVDLSVRISGDTAVRTAIIEKANDQDEGPLTSFALEVVDTSKLDEDGEPIRTAILSADAQEAARRRLRPKGQAGVALKLLERAIDEAGEPSPGGAHIPNCRVTRTNLWREYCYRGLAEGLDSDKPDTKRKAFSRAARKLQDTGFIGLWGDYVWPTGQAGH